MCPYNTLWGCNVVEKNGTCPLENLNKRDSLGLLVKTNDVLFRKIKKEKCNHYRKIGGIGHCACQKLFGFCDCKGNKAKCDYYEENRVQRFQVVIADDNIFVICPIIYDEKEKSDIVKYDKAEIYANQLSVNTLEELRFEKWI
jgi:hypothetical protein